MSDKSTAGDRESEINYGSTWHRWEPHVHTPGTLLNDQFTGPDPWGKYLDKIEGSNPPIRAIAVTDYYLAGSYEEVLQEKTNGRLPNVDLIFPNIEMRLDVGTMKGRWVNVHLLVSPEDPEHVTQLRRFLARLRFRAHGDTFACTPEDLTRLGIACERSITTIDCGGVSQHLVEDDQELLGCDAMPWLSGSGHRGRVRPARIATVQG